MSIKANCDTAGVAYLTSGLCVTLDCCVLLLPISGRSCEPSSPQDSMEKLCRVTPNIHQIREDFLWSKMCNFNVGLGFLKLNRCTLTFIIIKLVMFIMRCWLEVNHQLNPGSLHILFLTNKMFFVLLFQLDYL